MSWSSSEGSDPPIMLDHGFSLPMAAYMLNLKSVMGEYTKVRLTFL